ncbi:MAG: DUF499 domain-containing protein [Bacteroidota bacterium]
MPKLPWTPWHEAVRLRDDLRSGDLSMNMFAADLYEVVMQRGKRPVYEQPEHFFALTYPTFNLRKLVRDVVLRLAGKNDKAVRQLELTYGGGKTHTLITLRHLVHDPSNLPKLSAVAEFRQEIGVKLPKCRVAALCFDKLDVEKGMEVRGPNGETRLLKRPWSILAYQIAGDDGLRLLHADDKAEERETAPAENLLIELLEQPAQEDLGTLILIDEVLMYAREKVGNDPARLNSLVNFFQYLTGAATKVDRCCIVASLLSSQTTTEDELGRRIKSQLYDIFQRQREETLEPVVKEDVAEVLRRRFFTPESIKDKDAFRQHVVAALKGITGLDEQTARQGAEAEDRFWRSYPFHPDLTEVLYSKWTQLNGFQRARGVLRIFALALREAEKWELSPLIGPAVLLAPPDREGLSEALREMVTVADNEESEGKKQAWTGILDDEFQQAQTIQRESVGLKHREIEQAVVAAFLHSQPIGQTARTRDVMVLLGPTRPDKIELEKGLMLWAQTSYWLDDRYTGVAENQLPGTWRLGNRPNLNQMHKTAAKGINDDLARARLIDEIRTVKALTADASAAGVRVHTLPDKPRDVGDDGDFHYAVLGLNAASEAGKPSDEAKQFLNETTGAERERVYRNAVVLLVPSADGIEVGLERVRDYLAWEIVNREIQEQEKAGEVDPARVQTLRINIEKARGRIPEAIKQAYCIVVTVSEKNEAQAFRITIDGSAPHFTVIKNDKRSRMQDTAVTAEALLPGGPYDLWRDGETWRRVKDLAGAFAQLPHLPKMLKANAILDTLADGCEKGLFVLRLARPDHSVRTWWMSQPDSTALNDPALELVLPEAAELAEIPSSLLAPKRLPGLWTKEEITASAVADYFSGSTVVNIPHDGYEESVHIPKADKTVVDNAIAAAVESGILWLISGPASILAEPIPPGLLNPQAILYAPPEIIAAAAILPENLPEAWHDGLSTGLSIATAISNKDGRTLPWKTVRDVISAALQARFIELDKTSHEWPCDFPGAQFVKLKMAAGGKRGGPGGESSGDARGVYGVLTASAELELAQIQDLSDIVPNLLAIKAKANVPISIMVRIALGDGKVVPPDGVAQEVNALLNGIKKEFNLH